MKKTKSVAAAVVFSVAALNASIDWPQWQGPDRTGMSKETGLLKVWPSSGPSTIWTTQNLGNGYGSIAVAGERIYVQGMTGGNSTVFALNRADGKGLWS